MLVMPVQQTRNVFRYKKQSFNNTYKLLTQVLLPMNSQDHTSIIEAHITSSNSKKSQQKVDRHLRNCIITSCSDADVMVGTKHIDPALCIHIGAHLICIDNKHLNSKTLRGNRTLCRVLGIKLRKNATTYKRKNYSGKKCG